MLRIRYDGSLWPTYLLQFEEVLRTLRVWRHEMSRSETDKPSSTGVVALVETLDAHSLLVLWECVVK